MKNPKSKLDKILEKALEEEINSSEENILEAAVYKLLNKKRHDIKRVVNKSVDEWTSKEEDIIDKNLEGLTPAESKKVVVLPYSETQVEPPNTKVLYYTVKKGESLKDICKKYHVSFGELSNYMMAKLGTTVISPGMRVPIPRHFIDLSQA